MPGFLQLLGSLAGCQINLDLTISTKEVKLCRIFTIGNVVRFLTGKIESLVRKYDI
jgi:hypothetical protein